MEWADRSFENDDRLMYLINDHMRVNVNVTAEVQAEAEVVIND